MLRSLLVITGAVSIAVPGAAGSGTMSASGRFDRALAQLASMRGGPPGVVAVVQRGSKRVVFRHGVADRASRRRIALADHWRIASVSKAFSGAAALTLVARGKLALDDTI